ncbi:MAG: methylated-DNA-[protein]-cysteine S-methyltransferase [Gammaproteobacteria bacterium]|jgi:methylated-DNA-[protein]-cysteine S-methyltransferase
MSSRYYSSVISTPVANLGMQIDDTSLNGLSWLPKNHPVKIAKTGVARDVFFAIKAYLKTGEPLPTMPIRLVGTVFQLKVWEALKDIPMGTVVSYGDMAKQLNTSSRAIGQACRTNPVVLFIPCHRVVSANGIGGYMGIQKKINIKKWILHHEGYICP